MTFRLAFRALRRSPWYATTAIATVGLSIALAATVFAVVDGVLFKSLPYPSRERLFHLAGEAGPGAGTGTLSPADVGYLTDADARIKVTGYRSAPVLRHPARPDLPIWSAAIDDRFFDVLGQRPLLGGFTADHFRQPAAAAQPRPAIVSHAFWRQWLGGDIAAVGRTIDMVGASLTIVGVLPRDFVFPHAFGRIRPDVLMPVTPSSAAPADRWGRSLDAVARLREDISVDAARSTLSAALAARIAEYPARPEVRPGPYVAVSMRRLDAYLGARERPLFRVAFAGAGLLVVLAALNLAGLFAARGRDRHREFALRVALGAGRTDLAGLMMAEALLVALAGSVAGLIFAKPLLATLLVLLPDSLLLLKVPAIDWRAVTFGVLAATVVVSAFALAPAVLVARSALSQRMSASGTSTPRVRTVGRRALLAAESAIGIALVVAGSLVVASFVVLRGEDAGFDADGLAILEILTPGAVSPAAAQARHARVLERVRVAQAVNAAATIGVPLLENMLGGSQFTAPAGANRLPVNDVPVSGAFFETAQLDVLEGRVLTEREIEAGSPVAVVSELTAHDYWPGGRAVGQTLRGNDRHVTVVGVVEEARIAAHDERRQGEIYLPARLSPRGWTVYLLRTTGDPDVVARQVGRAVQNDVPGVLVRRAESFDRALLKSVRLHRFRTAVFATSASASLLLLAVGIAGLVATSVARRVREIGIRSALGARRAQLVRMLIAEPLRPSLAGVAIGLLLSSWTTRLVGSFLYGVEAHDKIVWAAAASGLVAVVIVSAWIPARRVGAINAVAALRAE